MAPDIPPARRLPRRPRGPGSTRPPPAGPPPPGSSPEWPPGAPRSMTRPVGLLGVQKKARSSSGVSSSRTAPVRSKFRARSRMWRTTVQPAAETAASYSEKVGAVTRARRGPSEKASRKTRSAAPLPQRTCPGATPSRRAMAAERAGTGGLGSGPPPPPLRRRPAGPPRASPGGLSWRRNPAPPRPRGPGPTPDRRRGSIPSKLSPLSKPSLSRRTGRPQSVKLSARGIPQNRTMARKAAAYIRRLHRRMSPAPPAAGDPQSWAFPPASQSKSCSPPAGCPGPPAAAASVWAELGLLCFFRSRRKIFQAFFPIKACGPGGQAHQHPRQPAGRKFTASSSRAAARPK